MSKPDLKEVIDIAKTANIGGVLSILVIGAIVGFVYGSGCGPVRPSRNHATAAVSGRAIIQDHPEQAPSVAAHGDAHQEGSGTQDAAHAAPAEGSAAHQ